MSNRSSTMCGVEESRVSLMGEDVVEIPILLSGREVSILETVAHQRGLTAGMMVRHLLRDFLVQTAPVCSGQEA